MNYTYDWAWRKIPGPMTFRRLFFEAMEACSLALYERWRTAMVTVSELYLRGEMSTVDRRTWQRLIRQTLVRAYLFERRAGTPPRLPIRSWSWLDTLLSDVR